ncbi:hypothetical protein [Actinoallomurus sp. NPDC050550]|uniref:hypothetical protein n=1 Tax=unclassified Actinoallomurus TaxID=2624323 RepID=UPI00340572AE
MTINSLEDVHELAGKLVTACQAVGLDAQQQGPTRVYVHAPGTSNHLSEIVTAKPDENERLCWWWSWDKPICGADEIEKAVEMIKKVVSVPLPPRK